MAKRGDRRQLLAAVVAHEVLHVQQHLRGRAQAASCPLDLTRPRV